MSSKNLKKNLKIIIQSQKDDYVDEHSKELTTFLQAYNRKNLDSRISEEKGKFDNNTSVADKKKEDTIEALRKWSTDFITKNSPTKLKANQIFDRARHWFGNLKQDY